MCVPKCEAGKRGLTRVVTGCDCVTTKYTHLPFVPSRGLTSCIPYTRLSEKIKDNSAYFTGYRFQKKEKNIARIARAALHKCLGKLRLNVNHLFVGPVCPVRFVCHVFTLCPVYPVVFLSGGSLPQRHS